MPQTSPINWTILSLIMILSILFLFSSNNEKMNQVNPTKMNFYLTAWSWNW